MSKELEILTLDELKYKSNNYINNTLSREVDSDKSKVIKVLNYGNQIKLLQNELKNKNYNNFRIVFENLYKENKVREMNQIFYDIIWINKSEIIWEATHNWIFYMDSWIDNIPDTIWQMKMKEWDTLTDIWSWPWFLWIFAHFYSWINFKGIELNKELVEIWNTIIKEFNISNNVKLISIDATEYNYSETKFIYMFAPLWVSATLNIINKLKTVSEKDQIQIYNVWWWVFMLSEILSWKWWLESKFIPKNSNKLHLSIDWYKKWNQDELSDEEIKKRVWFE